jgi:hypothetical protein
MYDIDNHVYMLIRVKTYNKMSNDMTNSDIAKSDIANSDMVNVNETKIVTIHVPSFQIEHIIYVPTFNITVPTILYVPEQYVAGTIDKSFSKKKMKVMFRYVDCKFKYIVNNILYYDSVASLDVYTPFTYTIDYDTCVSNKNGDYNGHVVKIVKC